MGQIEKEREMLRDAAKKLAEKVIAPEAEKIDETAEFPRDIVGAIGAQGLLGIMLPEDYGGMEGDITSLCLVAEEIAKVSGTCSWIVVIQAMGCLREARSKKKSILMASPRKIAWPPSP